MENNKNFNVAQPITAQQLFDNEAEYLGKVLKIMEGAFGGGFYVKFLQDEGSKKGWIQLIIVYPDNQCKKIRLCKNVFLEPQNDDENIGSIERGDDENKTTIMPTLTNSLEYGNYRMLEKYETPQMPIPSDVIWKQIVDNFHKIPVTTISETETLEGVYWRLYQIALEEKDNDQCASYRVDENRFLVTKDEMRMVAEENGYSLSQIRNEFNTLGILIKDKGSTAENGKRYNSYQLTKKISGITTRFYALKRNIKPKKSEIDESCAIIYSEELQKTPAEKALEKSRAQIESLKSELSKKDEEIQTMILKRIDDPTDEELLKCY